MEPAEGSSTIVRARMIDRVVLAVVVAGVYLPAVSSVGLRTDVGAHLRFAEYQSLTGRTPSPYYLFEQLVIGVRAILPFQALERLDSTLGGRATIWDVSGVIVLLAATIWLVQLVYTKLTASTGAALGRGTRGACMVLSLATMVVAPITLLTWSSRHLLNGYISITSYENPTVILARPFALVLFWVLIERFFDRNAVRTVAFATLMSALVLHAKPSFTICLLPAMCLLALWARWRSRPFDGRLFWLGFVLPSTAVLSFQLFMAQGEGGFAIAPFRVIRELFGSRGQSPWLFAVLVVLSCLFPLLVATLYWSRVIGTLTLVMAWLTFGIGLAMFCLLTVTGRTDYGDFIWGPQMALFVLFVESIRLVLPDLVGARRRLDVRAGIVLVALTLHVVCGAVLWYHEVVDPAAWW